MINRPGKVLLFTFKKETGFFVSQEPRSCSLDFHLSIWILALSHGFHPLKGKNPTEDWGRGCLNSGLLRNESQVARGLSGKILFFSNWVASITSMIDSVTSSYPSSCIIDVFYIFIILSSSSMGLQQTTEPSARAALVMVLQRFKVSRSY